MPLLLVACDTEEVKQTPVEDNLDELVNRNDDTTLTIQEKYETENLRIEFEYPIVFASTENIAIPIIYDETSRDKMSFDRTYFNIAVIVPNSKDPVMVFNDPVNIIKVGNVEPKTFNHTNNYQSNLFQYSEESPYRSMLFIEVENTIGKSSKRKSLFIYNLRTLKLDTVTPEDLHLNEWHVLNNKGEIYMKMQTDSNEDGEINEQDDENIFIYNVSQPDQKIRPIFNLEILKKMKQEVVKSKH